VGHSPIRGATFEGIAVAMRVYEPVVKGMPAEPGAAPDPALPSALESLAWFAGVGSVSYAGPTAFGVS
jgi:hypothetical protein